MPAGRGIAGNSSAPPGLSATLALFIRGYSSKEKVSQSPSAWGASNERYPHELA